MGCLFCKPGRKYARLEDADHEDSDGAPLLAEEEASAPPPYQKYSHGKQHGPINNGLRERHNNGVREGHHGSHHRGVGSRHAHSHPGYRPSHQHQNQHQHQHQPSSTRPHGPRVHRHVRIDGMNDLPAAVAYGSPQDKSEYFREQKRLLSDRHTDEALRLEAQRVYSQIVVQQRS